MKKNKHEYGDCSFCGGEVREQLGELDYRYQGQLYIFEAVPAGVCQQCGEKYLTAAVAKAIERRIHSKTEWKKTRSVPVAAFTGTRQ